MREGCEQVVTSAPAQSYVGVQFKDMATLVRRRTIQRCGNSNLPSWLTSCTIAATMQANTSSGEETQPAHGWCAHMEHSQWRLRCDFWSRAASLCFVLSSCASFAPTTQPHICLPPHLLPTHGNTLSPHITPHSKSIFSSPHLEPPSRPPPSPASSSPSPLRRLAPRSSLASPLPSPPLSLSARSPPNPLPPRTSLPAPWSQRSLPGRLLNVHLAWLDSNWPRPETPFRCTTNTICAYYVVCNAC